MGGLYTGDTFLPAKVLGEDIRHDVIVVFRFEEQVSTKQGRFYETVLFDGSLCDEMGFLLHERTHARLLDDWRCGQAVYTRQVRGARTRLRCMRA